MATPRFRSPSGRRLVHAVPAAITSIVAALAVVTTFGWVMRYDVALAQNSPSVQTDQAAYAAGDEISISGQGFAAGESVTLAVTHEDGTAEPGMGHEAWAITADEGGRVSATWTINADDGAGRRFVVVAVGATSGPAPFSGFLRRPAVATDSSWYIAGDTVTITGRDFAAGETATVQVIHTDGTAEADMGHESFAATVGPHGTFQATWTVRGTDLAGPQLAVTTAGSLSGEVEPAAFLRIAGLATDKPDYQPGEIVVISGRGFAPGEPVKLQVTHADGRTDGNGHEPFDATADETGSVTATWFVNHDALGFKFLVTAKGETSGVGGGVTFWDAGPFIMTTLGTAYTDNFDTLATAGTANPWTDDSTLPGWFSQQTMGTGPTTYRADAGSSAAEAIYSYGTGTSTERALGSIASGTPGNFLNAARLVNNTGSTITSLLVSYTGEQWRAGGCTPTPCTPAAQKLDFQYQVVNSGVITDANTPSTGWADHNGLDFTSPTPGTSTAAALDGNAAANRSALSSTLTVTVNPGQEVWLRWLDVDDANNDHGLAIDDFSVTPQGVAGGQPALTVNDVSLNEGNAGVTTFTFTVSLSAPAPAGGVTFDIATADGPAGQATQPGDYTQKALTSQTIPAGSSTYAFAVLINGDTTFETNETFFVNVTGVTGASVADGQGQGTIVNDDAPLLTFIHDVQGPGAATPIPGVTVAVEGVVVANFQGTNKLQGFFLEEEDPDHDANPATSEGILVFCGACPTAVAEGQRVRVTGSVSEFFNLTEITASTAGSVVVTNAGNNLAQVTPFQIDLPVVGVVDDYYESREGMRVTFVDSLTVSEHFELGRFGQIVLYEGGRPRQFTEANTPSVAGFAANLDALSRRKVILDDDNNAQQSYLTSSSPAGPPDGLQFVYYPRANGGLSVGTQGTDFFRAGDLVNGLTGVLHWSFPGFGDNTWRIRPTSANPATFTVGNPRPTTPPAVGGEIKAVGMNLLNYFTTIDTTSSSSTGDCGPGRTLDCRGADSAAELARQRERAAAVICAINGDVYGLAELENTTATDSIIDLLAAVNVRCGGANPYVFVNTGGTLGTDAIRVQQIYRAGIVSPVGPPLVDLDPVHNRPPTAQTFDVVDAANSAFGERFTVVVNHFRARGCPGTGADADAGDGQGCFNGTRIAQADRLLTWINATVLPAAGDPDVLLLGDFNAYAREDPITTLQAGGFNDLETTFHGANAYSYLFDGQLGHLDYGFASSSLLAQVTGAGAWHINADEVDLFDYNDEIRDSPGESAFEEKPDGSALVPPRVVFQPNSPYRASDHDPVVVGLFRAAADLSITTTDSPDPVTAGETLTYTLTITNNGPAAATGVTATDTLPAGAVFGSASPGCVNSAGTVTCTIGALASGASEVRTITVTVPATPGSISNTASVTGSPADPDTANNSATATTAISPSLGPADLSITKDAVPSAIVGATLFYTLVVSNSGPQRATGVTIADPLPANVTYESSGSTPGSCTYSVPTRTVTCAVGALESGASALATIGVKPTQAGKLTNTAAVSGDQTDPNASNNSDTVSTTVMGVADLSISQTGAPDPVRVDSVLTYTLTIVNAGPDSAQSVIVKDSLPLGAQFVSSTTSRRSCQYDRDPGRHSVTCSIGTLAPGETATVTIEIRPTAKGTMVNSATTTSAAIDLNPLNNLAVATTTVIP